jgi:hypothetical protein
MLIQYQKVSFTNISNEYDSNLNSPRLIKTKINDGPNLYTSFFEQLIISFILNHFNDKVTLYQNYNQEVLQSSRKLVIQDIEKILTHFNSGSQKYSFYLMNYCLPNNPVTIQKLKNLITIL